MFGIQKEVHNICRMEFLIPQPALIRSLAKIIQGAMIYDDIIRFKAARIERFSGKLTSYEESLRFIWCIATQLKYLILETQSGFYTFRLENIWRIDDKFVYIDDLMEIDDSDNIVITHFINQRDLLLSPELRDAAAPVSVHYKTIYYSFGKLLQTISDYPLDISDCILKEPEKRAIRFP